MLIGHIRDEVNDYKMNYQHTFLRYGKFSKVFNIILFLFSNKNVVIKAGVHKCLLELQTGKTQVRLLLNDQTVQTQAMQNSQNSYLNSKHCRPRSDCF